MPEYPLLPSEANSQELYWLLEVTWMGRTFRWATEDVEIEDGDGNTVPFPGGLSVRFTERVDFFSGSASVPSVSIRNLIFPVDVAEKIAAGHPLVRAPTTLSLWSPDRADLTHKIVKMVGKMTLTDYGENLEAIGFTLVPDGIEGSVFEPPSAYVINDKTWPDHEEESNGKYYPTVIGEPGFSLGGRVTGINAGSPAYVVDTVNNYLLIAGHRCVASSVQIVDRTAGVAAAFTPDTREDGLGNVVTTVTLAGTVPYVAGNEYWVRWNIANSGGLENPWATGKALEGLGDVIRWALDKGGITADTGRWLSIRDSLNAYKVATYLDRPTDLWAWVTRALVPLAPLSILTGPSGLYPVLWRSGLRSSDVRADIDVDRDGLTRSSPVRYDDSSWGTIQRVRYAPRSDGGKPYYVVTASGDGPSDDPSVISSVYLRAAYNQLGAREAKPLDLTTVYDTATAQRTLGWRAQVFSRPWRTVEYQDVRGRYSWLRAGAPVLLTDSDLHLSSRLCWLAAVSWEETVPTYTVVLLDDLVRDSRT